MGSPRRRKTTSQAAMRAFVTACVLCAQTAQAAPKGSEERPESAAAAPPIVRLGPITTQGGEVPAVSASLEAALPAVGRCVADHGGLEAERGVVEIRFLVRARGRAEGVETPTVRGASPEAGRCVRKLLKDRRVGAPTHEPVGVTARVLLAANPSPKAPPDQPSEPPREGEAPRPPGEPPPPDKPPSSREGERAPEPPSEPAPERPERSRSSKHRPGPARPPQPSK